MKKPKINVSCTMPAKILIFVLSILLVFNISLFGLMFFEFDDTYKVKETYTNEQDVINSRAYDYTISSLQRTVKEENKTIEIKNIYFMYIEIKEHKSLDVYIKILYEHNNQITTKYFLHSKRYVISHLFGNHYETTHDKIDKSLYDSKLSLWLTMHGTTESAWARENSYNEYAVSVFNSIIRR